MKKLALGLWALASLVWSLPAHAQLNRGDFRFSLDTDMISVGHVSIDPDGPAGEYDQTVFGIGPSELGASRVTAPTSPVGLGLGYVLRPKLVLGLRLGFGFDIVAPDNNGEDQKTLAVSLQPNLTIVPIGKATKLFIALAPLFQANRLKTGPRKERWLQGGFSVGIGALIFPTSAVSADLGFFFEGRFGNQHIELNDNGDTVADVADLRGIVRLGLSLWR
jgi:hypothetical protein